MIGSIHLKLNKVDSTNLYLHNLIKSGSTEEGTVITAFEQTHGRGQIGNHWESKKGENLTFSFVVYPSIINVINQFLISKFVSLAIADLLKNYVDKVKIKWPNDIYIEKKKISGILIENVIKGSEISYSIIGIGLNINQKKFSAEIPNATSLCIETGVEYDLDVLQNELFEKLNMRFKQLKSVQYQLIDRDYMNALYQFNELCEYKANNETFSAQIVDIETDGRLCLADEKNNLLKFAYKELTFL